MKKIGTTETGLLVEMSAAEFDSARNPNTGALLKIVQMADDIITLARTVLPAEVRAVARAVKITKPRRKYVRKAGKEKRIQVKRVDGAEKKKSHVELAVEVLKASTSPLTMDAIVDKMKQKGCTFRAKNPALSLGIQISQAKAAFLVGRVGVKGLWTVPGSREEQSLSSHEKILVNAAPAELTDEAKVQRRLLLIQLNRKLADKGSV